MAEDSCFSLGHSRTELHANKQEVEEGAALLINFPSPYASRERVRVRVAGE
jgi:hypothetical protein